MMINTQSRLDMLVNCKILEVDNCDWQLKLCVTQDMHAWLSPDFNSNLHSCGIILIRSCIDIQKTCWQDMQNLGLDAASLASDWAACLSNTRCAKTVLACHLGSAEPLCSMPIAQP